MITIQQLVEGFAWGMKQADARRPVAVNQRSGVAFQPGIGPHSESATVELVAAELRNRPDFPCRDSIATQVPYPSAPRSKCDLCFGNPVELAVEVKMLRMIGDNGKPNDNILMHILSPYPQHRSAVTDCDKLLASGFLTSKAILIFCYESQDWPIEPAIMAFEALASRKCQPQSRFVSPFLDLVHPFHRSGAVWGWYLA